MKLQHYETFHLHVPLRLYETIAMMEAGMVISAMAATMTMMIIMVVESPPLTIIPPADTPP